MLYLVVLILETRDGPEDYDIGHFCIFKKILWILCIDLRRLLKHAAAAAAPPATGHVVGDANEPQNVVE